MNATPTALLKITGLTVRFGATVALSSHSVYRLEPSSLAQC